MFFPSGFPKTVNTLKTPKQGPFISVVLYNVELHYILQHRETEAHANAVGVASNGWMQGEISI